MTIENMNKDEFQKLLEGLINNLKNKGILNPNVSTKDLAKSVTDELHNNPNISISGPELKTNPEMMQKIGVVCMAKANPQLTFDITLLFKPSNDIDPDDLKNNLKNLFAQMMKLNPTYKNADQNKRLEIDEKLDEMAEVIANRTLKYANKDALADNNEFLNILAGCLATLTASGNKDQEEFYRELYGVSQIAGGTMSVVQEVPVGNQMGVLDLATSGLSFMGQVDNPDPGAPDPLGIKMGAIINRIAEGDCGRLENELVDEGVIPSGAPKPTPAGYNHH